jgi:putative acetyltransferase
VTISIRPEQKADYAAVAAVVEEAFGDPNVARLVELLRASEYYVPELALVAEDGAVVGHIMFSYVTLLRAHDERRVLCLSPLAVRPEQQRKGIGAALVRAGIARAEEHGEPLVIVEGIPAYYPKFGFERARLHGIEPPSEKILDAAFMVLRLTGYDPSLRGQIIYSPAFDIVSGPV